MAGGGGGCCWGRRRVFSAAAHAAAAVGHRRGRIARGSAHRRGAVGARALTHNGPPWQLQLQVKVLEERRGDDVGRLWPLRRV